MFFHKRHEESQNSTEPKQLSGQSTVAEWLDHPVGGALFREMLQKAGQNEKVLMAVKGLPFERLIALSHGKLTQEMLDDMVARANASEVSDEPEPAPAAEEADTEEPEDTPPANEEAPAPRQDTPAAERFKGKTVVVTGAGSGIGRATALRVAKEGGRVIAVDISEDCLNELKNETGEHDITVITGDITNDETIEAIVNAAGQKIDALANVAGVMDNMTPLHEMSDDVWQRVMNINVTGMMKLSRAVLPRMLEQGGGSIVNVGSEASLKGSVAGAAYTTSKHAVVGLSKSMAFMYGPSGIRTNVVAPGAVLTNIEASFESDLGSERVNTILATMPQPAEAPALAAAIAFLLSDDSANINGAILPSDGGWSVQ